MALVELMIAGRVSSVSITERSSDAWTMEQVVWVMKSNSAAFGRLRFSSVKVESMPPPSLTPGNTGARSLRDLLDRRLLRTLRAGLPGFQVGGARDDNRIDLQARALRGRCNGLERRLSVGFVRNDDLKDDLRGGGFGRLPDPLELRESRAVPQIGMTDEEARLQRPQGVNRRRRRFDLVMGQRNAEFRHAKRKALTQYDRDRAAHPCSCQPRCRLL